MTVTHPEHQSDYDAGRRATIEDVEAFGFATAHKKWHAETTASATDNFGNLGAYYYAKGGLDVLVEAASKEAGAPVKS
jgi:hypothetical protein